VLEGFPSAGGMPDRVKCLHVLVGHSLAAGEGVNPLGDEALAMLPEWWRKGSCVTEEQIQAGVEALQQQRAEQQDHAEVIAAKERLTAERAAKRAAAEQDEESE
jgi:hypothetical protein